MTCYVTVVVWRPDSYTQTIRKSKPCSYVCPFDEVEKGDHVIVPWGEANGLQRGIIHEVDPPANLKRMATKWVAAHVNHRAHNMRTALGVPQLGENEDV